jgi:hypothetical protein
MGLRITGPATDTPPLSSGHKQPLKFPIQLCPWALWMLRRSQRDRPLLVSCPQVATGLPGLEESRRAESFLPGCYQRCVVSKSACRAPSVWLSLWAVCVGPSDHRVDFPLVAQGPKRLSVSKTRASHLVFKDLRVGESPCLAGISDACCEALGKAVNLSRPCPFTGMQLHLLTGFSENYECFE